MDISPRYDGQKGDAHESALRQSSIDRSGGSSARALTHEDARSEDASVPLAGVIWKTRQSSSHANRRFRWLSCEKAIIPYLWSRPTMIPGGSFGSWPCPPSASGQHRWRCTPSFPG